MKLNFNLNIKGLDKKEIPNANAGKILGSTFSQLSKGSAIKILDWALKMYNQEDIEVDATDFDVMYSLVETCDLPILTKGQIMSYMKEVKEKADTKKAKETK